MPDLTWTPTRRAPELGAIQSQPALSEEAGLPNAGQDLAEAPSPMERELGVAESLVKIAAEVAGDRSEDAARAQTIGAFAKIGVQAAFVQPQSGARLPLSPDHPADWVHPEHAACAASTQTPVFGAGPSGTGEALYLPIPRQGQPEVLALRGGRYESGHVPLLELFAHQLAAVLDNARWVKEAGLRKEELAAVAEVANLAAGPGWVPLQQLLRAVARAVDANVLMLHMFEAERQALLLLAHVDLPPALAGRFAERSPEDVFASFGPRAMDSARVQEETGGQFGEAVVLPIRFGGAAQAVLTAFHKQGHPLPKATYPLLKTLGELLASALERRRLREEASRQLIETALLLELTRITSGSLELADILDAACDFLVKLLDVSNCFIFLLDRTKQVLEGAAASAVHRGVCRTMRLPIQGRSAAAAAVRSRSPVVVEDAENSPVVHPAMVALFGQKALMALPLVARDELVGVVVVGDVRAPRKFPPQFIALAEATTGQLALSVQNARFYESLKESYAQLARTRAEMVKQERLAALGELSAIVAHEVRNPLGVIFNAVSSLKRLTGAEGDTGTLLTIVREECERLDRIVNDLLDFSRPIAPSLELSEFRGFLEESVDAALASQPANRYQVHLRVEEGLPKVAVDGQLIRQALINVIINALQAMPHGGALRVTAERDGPSHVHILVSDEGRGVPPEVAPRIFEPFFTTKAKGTGLGLAVVRRIVEDHGGEVVLHSSPGEGATFIFRLPWRTETENV